MIETSSIKDNMNDTKKIFTELGLFKEIIGQERAKKQFGFYLDSYYATRIFPNLMVSGPKGQGKTTLGREAAKGLVKFDENGKIELDPEKKNRPKRKQFIEVNCSTLKNVKQFINSLIIPYVQDKDVTLLFDEASEIPKDVSMALLTILNPNPESRTTFSYDEYVCDFDFRRQTFIFATSEVQQVFHALTDRLTRIDLEEYTLDQMGKIVQKGAKDVEFKDGVMPSIAEVLRGNARAAQKMADNIKSYLKGKIKFAKEDWRKLQDVLGILPLGLNPTELQVLRILADNNDGTSLTCLAAKTGLSRDSLQKDYEMYIQKHGLMQIETTGRQITAKGLEYLRALNKNPIFRSNCIVHK
jgi:Holliday junction resolvasome RuvABC ATP-dependent DNA helicase subunit